MDVEERARQVKMNKYKQVAGSDSRLEQASRGLPLYNGALNPMRYALALHVAGWGR